MDGGGAWGLCEAQMYGIRKRKRGKQKEVHTMRQMRRSGDRREVQILITNPMQCMSPA